MGIRISATVIFVLALFCNSVFAAWEFGERGSGKYLRLGGRIQFRWTAFDDTKKDENSFRIRRLRVNFEGEAFKNVNFRTELRGDDQFDPLSTSTSNIDRLRFEHVYLEFVQQPKFQVLIGQTKAAYSREEITSSARIWAIDRALIVSAVAPGQQVGVRFGSNQIAGGKLEYYLGVYNGNVRNSLRNDNNDYLYIGRVVVNPTPALSFGINAGSSDDAAATANTLFKVNSDGKRRIIGGEAVATLGPVFLYGEYHQAEFNPATAGLANLTIDGYFAHVGYSIIPGHLQPYFRYETFDPNDAIKDAGDAKLSHIGVNYFFSGHDWKIQAEYIRRTEEDGFDADNDQFLMQTQVAW